MGSAFDLAISRQSAWLPVEEFQRLKGIGTGETETRLHGDEKKD